MRVRYRWPSNLIVSKWPESWCFSGTLIHTVDWHFNFEGHHKLVMVFNYFISRLLYFFSFLTLILSFFKLDLAWLFTEFKILFFFLARSTRLNHFHSTPTIWVVRSFGLLLFFMTLCNSLSLSCMALSTNWWRYATISMKIYYHPKFSGKS